MCKPSRTSALAIALALVTGCVRAREERRDAPPARDAASAAERLLRCAELTVRPTRHDVCSSVRDPAFLARMAYAAGRIELGDALSARHEPFSRPLVEKALVLPASRRPEALALLREEEAFSALGAALAYVRLGEDEQAERLARRDDVCGNTARAVALAMIRAGRSERARALLGEVTVTPGCHVLHTVRELAELGALDEAVRFARALENPPARLAAALALARAGQRAEAQSLFADLDQAMLEEQARARLAELLGLLGECERARALLAVDGPELILERYRLGLVCGESSEAALAVAVERIRPLEPDDSLMLGALALELAPRDSATAVQLASRAIEELTEGVASHWHAAQRKLVSDYLTAHPALVERTEYAAERFSKKELFYYVAIAWARKGQLGQAMLSARKDLSTLTWTLGRIAVQVAKRGQPITEADWEAIDEVCPADDE